MEKTTTVGPLVRESQRDKVELQVKDAVNKGAKKLLGGKRPTRKGYFYLPTILIQVEQNMRILREEVFGPVAPIIVVKDAKTAIEEANKSDFGLGASIWTADIEKGEKMARLIECGFVAINDLVTSHPELPFGGIKCSGIGRELSHHGLREFTNLKTVIAKDYRNKIYLE